MTNRGARLLKLATVFILGTLAFATLIACSASKTGAKMPPAPTAPALNLDAVFRSPTGLYTIRYNHTWTTQEVPSEAGMADYFKLPDGAFAVTTDKVQPGTRLDDFLQSTIEQYQTANIQNVERAGAINVGGSQGEMLHAVTYVTAQGVTVATPPSRNAQPRDLYQAFYVAGDTGYTFSISWLRNNSTNYLSLFRSMLQTFTLAGTS